ncbi:TetR/AcrR family transcriptional regulator [Plantibacter sp. YIM 135249]|uniref:TetR/AcrR family transcriptional regulator n=1 Tax=Plantibacter sp. YIM 135249 TaxID=3423918 RepID=UPI003D34C269
MTRIPASERRQALVRAALRVVAAGGVSAATTRAIVAEAGMSLASFHYAFASHDELMTELISHVVAEERVVLPADTVTEGDLRDLVRGGLQRYFESMRADPGREAAMLELTYYALRTPGLEHLAAEQYRRYSELSAEALEAAARLSGWQWQRPIDEIARLAVVFSDGVTVSWLVHHDERVAEELLDHAADFLTSLASPAGRSTDDHG